MAFTVGPEVTAFKFWLKYDSTSWTYMCFLHAFRIKTCYIFLEMKNVSYETSTG